MNETTIEMPEGAGSILHRDPKTNPIADAASQLSGDNTSDGSMEDTSTDNQVEEASVEHDDAEDLGYLADDMDDDDTADSQEGDEGPSNSFKFTSHDGEEVVWTEEDAKKFHGQQKALKQKEMEVAEDRKRNEAMAETLEYLKWQGDMAPKFHAHQEAKKDIEAAEEAWLEGKSYNGIPNDQLDKVIKKATIAWNKQDATLSEEAGKQKMPGLEVLKKVAPEITADNFADYSAKWGPVAQEFGFTAPEIEHNHDYRWMALMQEVVEGRAFRADIEAKQKRYAEKAGKGKTATKSAPAKSSKGAPSPKQDEGPDVNELGTRAATGDRDAIRELMNSGGLMRRK